MKRFIALVIMLALTAASTACTGSGEPVSGDDTPQNIADNIIDVASCVIIRPESASDPIIDAAVRLRKAMSDAFSADVKLTNDADMMYGADAENAPRIIIGGAALRPAGSDTTYYETAVGMAGEEDYVVMAFSDNTVVIAGKTDRATIKAAADFTERFVNGGEALAADDTIVLAGALDRNGDDYSGFTPVLRFAVASDVHIKEHESVECDRLKKLFEYSYNYADTQGYKNLDAVVFAGDVTDHGSATQLKRFRTIVEDNIREGTQFICAMGNHEFFGGSQTVFERVMGQSADQHNVINGIHFVSVSPSNGSDYTVKYDWLDEVLREAVGDAPESPVFVFQHHHIKDTVYVSEEWYTEQLGTVFDKYPNIIDFSGHSHGPINNPRSIYQDKYTALGTGTLSYFEMNSGMSYGTIPPNASSAAQFYIIEVDTQNRVKIMPFNILTGEFFTRQNEGAPDEQLVWYVPRPSDPSAFTYTRDRWSAAAAPYFDEDAVIVPTGMTANGTRVSFTFPQAHDDECVYSYTLTMSDGKKEKSYSVFSDYYIEPLPEEITISMAGIKAGTTYTVTVTAYDCYGAACEKPLTFAYTAE
jgi:predicted phosphodiesterase